MPNRVDIAAFQKVMIVYNRNSGTAGKNQNITQEIMIQRCQTERCSRRQHILHTHPLVKAVKKRPLYQRRRPANKQI